MLAVPFAVASAAVAGGALAAGVIGGGALGAVSGAADADWWKQEFGIPEDFVRSVGAMVKPGDSAIFAWLHTADPAHVAERLAGYGGTVLRTTLTSEQNTKLQKILDDRRLPRRDRP